jgi:hypothetical protein
METVLKTNDLVLLSLTRSVLQDASIDCVVLDEHMSALDGSIGAIPRRLVVAEGQGERARALVAAVQAGSWVPDDAADG